MQKLIRKIVVYLLSLAVAAAVVGTVFFFYNKSREKQREQLTQEENANKTAAKIALTEEEIEELLKEHKQAKTQENDTESVEESTEEEYEEEVSGIDWEGLWEINQDVYAWITVPGTVIDYPILQHETDNTYYLNYNIDGSYGYPGCIYTENLNAKDFSDNNTVIYGHNMKAGTMFAGLHQFEDKEFFDAHPSVLIYTPERSYEYTIFASYIYDDRHLLYSFDFANEDVYESYLENIQSMRDLNANFRSDVTVTKENKIITLVTCMSNQPDKRLLVQAVLNE